MLAGQLVPSMDELCRTAVWKKGLSVLHPQAWCIGVADYATALQGSLAYLTKSVFPDAVRPRILACFQWGEVCNTSPATFLIHIEVDKIN